jgi:hypothetical protein
VRARPVVACSSVGVGRRYADGVGHRPARPRADPEDPPIARRLFGDTRLAWLWLPLRLYVGYSWLSSGWGKFNNPAWMETGQALQGFWTNAVRVDGSAPGW